VTIGCLTAARARSVELVVLTTSAPDQIAPAIDKAKGSGAAALNVLTSSLFSFNSVQNLLRLLPGVAFRIVELFGPFLRIFKSMMEGAVGWAIHLMVRPRVFHGHFGPRLGQRVPNSSLAPHHRNNGYHQEYCGFHFGAFPLEVFVAFPLKRGRSVSLLGRDSSEHNLALLRSNNSWGDGSVMRRRQNEDLRTNWDVAIKIDNVIAGHGCSRMKRFGR
jgi:hypothetical protein